MRFDQDKEHASKCGKKSSNKGKKSLKTVIRENHLDIYALKEKADQVLREFLEHPDAYYRLQAAKEIEKYNYAIKHEHSGNMNGTITVVFENLKTADHQEVIGGAEELLLPAEVETGKTTNIEFENPMAIGGEQPDQIATIIEETPAVQVAMPTDPGEGEQ